MRWRMNYKGRIFYWSPKRFTFNMIIFICFITGLIFFITNSVKADATRSTLSIMVHQGDSLWSIAERIEPDRDPRIVIQELKAQNDLRTANLTAGQRLRISVAK
ncbi:LysM domain-containing protein [Hydrogenispora ethanolica]|uniref:LysM domain-containing protein n=2 Tax=Hydrogenispora ethanolica TaxID=1082276 RepID=A0A4R1RB01_HYDET|nr:LysM domain-containing protein [Hydrogenispora ethanolica]